MKYSIKPNTKKIRDQMVRELGAELLISAPTFTGTIIDRTSLTQEAKGLLNFKIVYDDKEYDLKEFKKLAGIK